MKKLIKKMSGYENIVLYGVDINTEMLVEFLKKNNIEISCIGVERMMVSPDKCSLILSQRTSERNAFSETEMMLDDSMYGVPLKRLDEIVFDNKTMVVVAEINKDEDQKRLLYLKQIHVEEYVFVPKALVKDICEELYSTYDLYEEVWGLQQKTISEIHRLKNCVRRQLKPTIYDFHFEFHIVEHCNLKCRGCTHFAPLAQEEFLSLEEFESDIKRLSMLTGGVARFINLLGGEPLLHPQVEEFGVIARKYFPETTIRIVTNGILLSNMTDIFWEKCSKNNISIGVTRYPIGINYNEIEKKITERGVDFVSFSGSDMRCEMWKLSIDFEGKQRPIDNFMKCPRANACVFCAHGKIYTCATMANIGHFNKFFNADIKLSESDYVDIYKVEKIEEIFEYLSNPTPFCRYCDISKREYGNRWIRSEKNIEEWI